MVRAEIRMNEAVYYLLGSLSRLLACRVVEVEEERENNQREQGRQQILRRSYERNRREEELWDTNKYRTPSNSKN